MHPQASLHMPSRNIWNLLRMPKVPRPCLPVSAVAENASIVVSLRLHPCQRESSLTKINQNQKRPVVLTRRFYSSFILAKSHFRIFFSAKNHIFGYIFGSKITFSGTRYIINPKVGAKICRFLPKVGANSQRLPTISPIIAPNIPYKIFVWCKRANLTCFYSMSHIFLL